MTSQTIKQIARSLDSAAARADMIDARPASGKQCWFLANLLHKSGEDADSIGMADTNAILTSKKASTFIGDFIQ